MSDAEKAISKQMGTLRSLSDADRAVATKNLALKIRQLPKDDVKLDLALGLANLSTEGYFGPGTLQSVTDSLVAAVKEAPQSQMAPYAYSELAQLSRYEQMKVRLDDPQFKAALAKVDETDAARKAADFTLTDIQGKSWTLSSLHGKVVWVNFWATWCPPCKKEMPDLETVYQRFKDRGLVILAISNEKTPVVSKFIADKGYDFPVLLDSDGSVNKLYSIQGIPNSFLYDSNGSLVATAMDMRTMDQMLAMLAKAGLK